MILEFEKLFFFGYGISGIILMDAEFKRINYTVEDLMDNHK